MDKRRYMTAIERRCPSIGDGKELRRNGVVKIKCLTRKGVMASGLGEGNRQRSKHNREGKERGNLNSGVGKGHVKYNESRGSGKKELGGSGRNRE